MPAFKKFDQDKPRPRLLPADGLWKLMEALEYGAIKYGDDNWMQCDDTMRYYDACLRHLLAWKSGEILDPESGLNHLQHATASLIFLLTLECCDD